jgi:hypothetical protein
MYRHYTRQITICQCRDRPAYRENSGLGLYRIRKNQVAERSLNKRASFLCKLVRVRGLTREEWAS